MKVLLISLVLLIGNVQLGHCQDGFAEPNNLAWKNTKAADIASLFTVGASIAVDTYYSWHNDDRKHAFLMQGIRTGVNIGAASLVKHFVNRTRPDGSDNESFYSEHTALTAMGPRLVFTIPLTVGTGYLRIAANKHYLTDTLVGAGVGFLTGKFIR